MKRKLNFIFALILLIAAAALFYARGIPVPAGAFGAGYKAQTVFGMMREIAGG